MAVERQAPMVALRSPVPGDVRRLEALERSCFPDPWPGGVILAELGAPARFQRVLVTPSGIVVAYLFSAWQYLDLHVLKVATDPSARLQGHAQRLLREAHRHALRRGGDTVTLEVRSSNTAARALYRKLGYAEVGRRRRYYGDGEDAIVMTLRLSAWPLDEGKE
jgi:ribosomal-protein-alanine N-acetyltransferase